MRQRSIPDAVLLQPNPNTVVVSYHPKHDGPDAVSVQLDDTVHGRFVLAFTPETVDHLARLLATSVKSSRVQATADQMKAAQRDR
ncbi:hypothetical protein HZU38_18905 [Mycolicibacterium vanbaalenii]|uniref:hypothetical protein n=1 Tax=Mycolicibacterium vanbaalenii TaxID=110539 RepID=UPI001F43C159|nr:hypothetical protein [Mycolicibacterium vanbaalenii]UJL27013.1 hypothetical protein HZU38_18905 [Mycolicibacterium vanbaalenii]WND59136.1 hypothetical protein QQA43_12510 [Mycolicibacterium vanbaalenii]